MTISLILLAHASHAGAAASGGGVHCRAGLRRVGFSRVDGKGSRRKMGHTAEFLSLYPGAGKGFGAGVGVWG